MNSLNILTMQNSQYQNGIFVSYFYNAREIEGIDEFKTLLEKEYLCQGKEKWIPSCSEGGEFWFKAFLATPFGLFVAELLKDTAKVVLVSAGKQFVLEPLKKAFSFLWKKNQDKWKLKVQRASFVFDDLEIVIGALQEKELDTIEEILKEIYCVKISLEKNSGFPVKRIELPAELIPAINKFELDSWRFGQEDLLKSIWIIVYADNSKILYNGKEGRLFEFSDIIK